MPSPKKKKKKDVQIAPCPACKHKMKFHAYADHITKVRCAACATKFVYTPVSPRLDTCPACNQPISFPSLSVPTTVECQHCHEKRVFDPLESSNNPPSSTKPRELATSTIDGKGLHPHPPPTTQLNVPSCWLPLRAMTIPLMLCLISRNYRLSRYY